MFLAKSHTPHSLDIELLRTSSATWGTSAIVFSAKRWVSR
jgi:hypothetical protein